MADVIEKPAGGWLSFALKVAVAVFIINFIFDALNVAFGRNLKAFWNRPVSLFYPGKAWYGGGISPPSNPTPPTTTPGTGSGGS